MAWILIYEPKRILRQLRLTIILKLSSYLCSINGFILKEVPINKTQDFNKKRRLASFRIPVIFSLTLEGERPMYSFNVTSRLRPIECTQFFFYICDHYHGSTFYIL